MYILSGLEVQSIKFVFGGLQLTVYLFILTVLWTRTHESPIGGLNFMVNPLQMSTVNWFVIGIGPPQIQRLSHPIPLKKETGTKSVIAVACLIIKYSKSMRKFVNYMPLTFDIS